MSPQSERPAILLADKTLLTDKFLANRWPLLLAIYYLSSVTYLSSITYLMIIWTTGYLDYWLSGLLVIQ